MKKIFSVILIILLNSCQTKSKLTIYKDKETISGYFTNSIADFPWKYKEEKVIDSIVIKGKKVNDIYRIINNMEKTPNTKNGIGTPRYAFIVEYNSKKDTLYCLDFNNENYKNEAYFIQNNITLKDSNNFLRDYLLKNYKKYIKKEFYTLPESTKEKFYYLNMD
jgi:hypothetical protein